jgi:hypothetical protein
MNVNFCSDCDHWSPVEHGNGHCLFFEHLAGGVLPVWVDSRAFERKLVHESAGAACPAMKLKLENDDVGC